MKIVCEVRGQTFKRKELKNDLPVIADKLQKLDLSNRAFAKVVPGESYYYIKHGETAVTTASAAEIDDVLELFDFKQAMDMFIEHMKNIDD